MTKDELIKDFETNIYCRIQRSAIHGVGVFAIKDIPKGAEPLATADDSDLVAIPEKEIRENKNIPDAVKEMIQAFYPTQDGLIQCPAHSLNQINISYFLNHSESPNLEAKDVNDESVFTANRDIRAGEELTVDYRTFSDMLS